MGFDNSILNDFKKTVKKLKKAINGSIQESMDKYKQQFLELQTQEQMYQGIDSKGIDIKPAYANSTIKIKRKKGQPTDRVTLFDTGAFYNSLTITARKNDAVIKSNINYSKYLILETSPFTKGYPNIFGLDEENLDRFLNNYTIPTIKKNFDDIITES